MDDLAPVEAWCADLIARLDPTQRRQLAREIAKTVREGNQKRITAQTNPDGSPFAPRKPQPLREKKGKIKRTMFAKLKTAKYLKAESTSDAAIVRFSRDVERIARVHHLGLRDKVNRKRNIEADYPKRELLGMTEAEEAAIVEITTRHLAGR